MEPKVKASHLQRTAYLYIRQSTLKQVFENTESTQRQYALRDRAVGFGWSHERIEVIDSDLGRSGAESDREGFQRLMTEVSLGRAGIVMGLEVSRLARNSTDWCRLLEICALTDTLILDEDGIYEPGHFNDRLLLGLKGTMSEAELHLLRARLQGGILNKARRGELRIRLPVGLVYDAAERPVLDPDVQIQRALRLVFDCFARSGSACEVVKHFRREGLQFPRRSYREPYQQELLWGELSHSRVLQVLHNPRYAGAFTFGRTRVQRSLGGKPGPRKLAQADWGVTLPDHHPGYISWQQFEANQQRLRANARARGLEHKTPPREGPALLQGIVVCGRCGGLMTVRYQVLRGQLVPHYLCQQRQIQIGEPPCQHVPGASVDKAISELLLETVTPINIEVALAVEQELQARLAQADALREKQIERARYEVELARRRYLSVDPDNRLVAGSLEADWNEKLRLLHQTQEEAEKQRKADRSTLNDTQRADVQALAQDFPQVWNAQSVSHRERKRLVQLLIEDVTLLKGAELTVSIRFKGGAIRQLPLPKPKNAWQLRITEPRVIEEIDRLLACSTYQQIADALNARGWHSGNGCRFNRVIVGKLCKSYHLKSCYDRLREAGLLTAEEMAQQLDVSTTTIKQWRRDGRLHAQSYNDKGDYLYKPLREQPRQQKYAWQKAQKSARAEPFPSDQSEEVQYEA